MMTLARAAFPRSSARGLPFFSPRSQVVLGNACVFAKLYFARFADEVGSGEVNFAIHDAFPSATWEPREPWSESTSARRDSAFHSGHIRLSMNTPQVPLKLRIVAWVFFDRRARCGARLYPLHRPTRRPAFQPIYGSSLSPRLFRARPPLARLANLRSHSSGPLFCPVGCRHDVPSRSS